MATWLNVFPTVVLVALAAVATALASGCAAPVTPAAGAPLSPVPTPATATVPAPPTTAATAVPTGVPPTPIAFAIVVEYRRSGGFAAFNDLLTIDSSRRAVFARKSVTRQFELDRQTFDQLVQQLDRTPFAALSAKKPAEDACCDRIEYTVTYKGHTVTALDGSVPPELQPVLVSLDKIIEQR